MALKCIRDNRQHRFPLAIVRASLLQLLQCSRGSHSVPRTASASASSNTRICGDSERETQSGRLTSAAVAANMSSSDIAASGPNCVYREISRVISEHLSQTGDMGDIERGIFQRVGQYIEWGTHAAIRFGADLWLWMLPIELVYFFDVREGLCELVKL
jgi:hypothetical protein